MTTSPTSDAWTRIRRARLVQVLGVYVGVSFGVLQAVDIFANRLPIPEWTFVAALALLVLGLPVVIATAILQARPRIDEEPGTGELGMEGDPDDPGDPEIHHPETGPPSSARGILTWGRTLRGGALGFAALTAVVIAVTLLGVFGIGPAGSLIAQGVLDERERILIADYGSQSGDSALAAAVTEAFRVDFEQSTAVMLVPPTFVGESLRRMGRSPAAPLDLPTARELAVREGIKAVVAGEINSAGGGFVLSARLLSAEDGAVLASRRETARDSTEIIDAVDRLSKHLRGQIGESLRTLRANEPLAQVSTSSLEALRRYSQAVRAADVERDAGRAIALLEEAIRLDSTFAMAHRKLGVVLSNENRPHGEISAALTRAHEHRDRLTDRERYLTLAAYYAHVEEDTDRAMTAYRTLLDLHPDEGAALNNLAILHGERGDHERAEELYRRAIRLDSLSAVRYTNLVSQLVPQGKLAAADSVLAAYRRLFPDHPQERGFAANLAVAQGEYARADSIFRLLAGNRSLQSLPRAGATLALGQLELLHGRIESAERELDRAVALSPEIGGGPLNRALIRAHLDLFVIGDSAAAFRTMERALREHPLEGLAPRERPNALLVKLSATLGLVDRARSIYEEQVRGMSAEELRSDGLRLQRADIAAAENRLDDAIREIRSAWEESGCPICFLPELGHAYVRAGQPDSAIAAYMRYIDTPWLHRLNNDALELPRIHRALGDLYTDKEDLERAARHYSRFVDLWSDADEVLQPQIERARRALELSHR